MHRNQSVNVHQFAMVPHADIPRSSFRIQTAHKTTFDAGYLIPIYVDEILPGDSFNLKMTAFTRLATPLVPIMDNLYLDSFFFFVPNRLLWSNWKKFMGEQTNPGDSISFTVPQCTMNPLGAAINSIFDYMGIPVQPAAGWTSNAWSVNTLPFRAYNLIWNEWFRDENLQNSVTVPLTDGPDAGATFTLLRRGKRHDYFTSALPFVQKGTAVSLPLGSTAPVTATGTFTLREGAAGTTHPIAFNPGTVPTNAVSYTGAIPAANTLAQYQSGLSVDLASATAATINQIRQAFQIQKLLERDARGGTRYTELVRSHFGVISPDARQQRPEYLGGGTSMINISPIPQTSATEATVDTPQANLAAIGQGVAHGHGFSQSFTEHGYIIGLISVRADLTYQQGLRKMWSRSTRYDYYFPVFAALGEQAVLNQEIYKSNVPATDAGVFGYQERWAEYRYNPSLITGQFRSQISGGALDVWHLAQEFTALPTLAATFIQDTPPIDRIVAIGAAGLGQQFLCDAFFDIKAARPMPMYSVPGLVDHF